MIYFYRKIDQRLTLDDATDSLSVNNNRSRVRNRNALNTLRHLILVYIIFVSPGNIIHIATHLIEMYYLADGNRPKFLFLLISYIIFMKALSYFVLYMNNILNIVVYVRMIPGFRDFLITIFTLGLKGKRSRTKNQTYYIQSNTPIRANDVNGANISVTTL